MIDFATLELTWKPNQYLVAPEGLCRAAKPHRTAPDFAETPAALAARFEAALGREPRLTWVGKSPDGLSFRLIQRSRIFRFPDTIDVSILPSAKGATLAIYSRARYGIRDFGVNRDRIENWLARLET